MKYLLLLLVLTGCGKISRIFTEITGEFTYKCSKEGVEYIQSDSGIAVSYGKNGKIVRCD